MKKKIKGRITQWDIAKACGLDQGTVSRILNNHDREAFAESTVKRVLTTAREMDYLHPSLVSVERRASPRKELSTMAKVTFVVNGSCYDHGTARIDTISLSGMLLKDFNMAKGVLPLENIGVEVESLGPKLKGFKARARIARFADNSSDFALALKYETIDEKAKALLKNFIKT
jgi:hypothetical protein